MELEKIGSGGVISGTFRGDYRGYIGLYMGISGLNPKP